MSSTMFCYRGLRSVVRTWSVIAAVSLSACDMLEVADPTTVRESDLQDAAGAQMLRASALNALAKVMPDAVELSGIFTDELVSVLPSWADAATWDHDALDRRDSERYERLADANYSGWQELRKATSVAMPKLRAHPMAGAGGAHLGEMFALRGFGVLRMAEYYCPGFPIHNVVDFKFVPGAPHSTDEALAVALADLDSAVTMAADSARILHFAQVLRGRALLDLGRFGEAAGAAAGVPTDYAYRVEYSASVGLLNFLSTIGVFNRSVADREGGNGLDFVSAEDPRVVLTPNGIGEDGMTSMYGVAAYPAFDFNAPIVAVRGVEARLIEAEAALRANQPQWLAILNELRRSHVTPALPELTDPGSEDARVNLLYRERAFWLFATGSRLGDLRRLISRYGRSPETVFPSGAYRLGGVYSTATSIPFPGEREHKFNVAVTGCTSR